MEGDHADHMDQVGDTDENATGGKELRQEQLAAPAPAAESLSSRRAGESSFFSRRVLGGTPEASSNVSMTSTFQKQAVLTGSLPASQLQGSIDQQASPQGQVVRLEIATPESQRFSYEALVQLGAEETPALPKSLAEEPEEADSLFVPDDDQECMKPKRPPPADTTGPAKQMTGPLVPESERTADLEAGDEEAEWLERKRVTGVIGRMVQYGKGDLPAKDVIGLHRSGRGRLMVTAVRGDGSAARAGVVAGDQLVSINGEKIWEYYPAKAVLNGVKGPVTLVFLGFSGKLQAEVRVKQPDEPRLGLPPQISVPNKVIAKTKREEDKKRRSEAGPMQSATGARGFSSFNPSAVELQLQDTVVFEHKPAYSMFIATEEADASAALNDSKPKTPKEAAASSSGAGSGVYELLREDARDILARALKGEIV